MSSQSLLIGQLIDPEVLSNFCEAYQKSESQVLGLNLPYGMGDDLARMAQLVEAMAENAEGNGTLTRCDLELYAVVKALRETDPQKCHDRLLRVAARLVFLAVEIKRETLVIADTQRE